MQGIAPGGLGTPGVTRAVRAHLRGVGLNDTSIVSHGADVRHQNIIAHGGYGWLDEDFGDVWRVEDGMIKCRGWLDGALGNNGRLARTLPANGWNDTVFGATTRDRSSTARASSDERSARTSRRIPTVSNSPAACCRARWSRTASHRRSSFGNPTVVEQFRSPERLQ
jgi:hypothetical protein